MEVNGINAKVQRRQGAGNDGRLQRPLRPRVFASWR